MSALHPPPAPAALAVPFVRMDRDDPALLEQLLDEVRTVAEAGAFTLGAHVEAFEADFAAYCEAAETVGVASGTDALSLALRALGVGPGDEVIVPANTFIATAEAVSIAGATPLPVDVDPETGLLTAASVERALGPRVRCVIPVHLYGATVDIDPLLELARVVGIAVVEDACQAHGARYKGRQAGSLAAAGCFSFYPGKNLGACGEAGAITTNDPALAHRIAMWRDHGSTQKYVHQFPGLNMRMEGVQGGVLSVKLRHLDHWNEQRRTIAREYASILAYSPITLPKEMDYATHVFHLYVIQTAQRDAVRKRLHELGIETGLHYPIPLHLQEAYAFLGYSSGSFPVTERLASNILSLPIYPGMALEAVRRVADELLEPAYVS